MHPLLVVIFIGLGMAREQAARKDEYNDKKQQKARSNYEGHSNDGITEESAVVGLEASDPMVGLTTEIHRQVHHLVLN